MPWPYQPFYCEENLWHLCQAAPWAPCTGFALLMWGERGYLAAWEQRAGAPGEPILWDYHAIGLSVGPGKAHAWDQDTRLACPYDLAAYLETTFRPAHPLARRFPPQFRLVPSETFLATFRSDRAHMRRRDGSYRKPPPPWAPPVLGSVDLGEFLVAASAAPGKVLDLAGLMRQCERLE